MFFLFSLLAECKIPRLLLSRFHIAILAFGFNFLIPCYLMYYKLDEIWFHFDPAESSVIVPQKTTCHKLYVNVCNVWMHAQKWQLL